MLRIPLPSFRILDHPDGTNPHQFRPIFWWQLHNRSPSPPPRPPTHSILSILPTCESVCSHSYIDVCASMLATPQGTFQVCLCCGSLLSAINRWCPFAMVGMQTLTSYTAVKLLLTVPVILLWRLNRWAGCAVQMIPMAVIGFFDGWISTLAVVLGPSKIKEEAIRGSLDY